MPADLPLTIEAHEDLGASHFLLSLSIEGAERAFGEWDPGQFVMIGLGQPACVSDPLLRRPFSIFNRPGRPAGRLQVLYKVLGRGTAILSTARPGATIRCLGPLGNGFRPPRAEMSRLLLVAGGIGSASLHPLALEESSRGGRPLVLYGCRTAGDVAGIRPTNEAGIECRVATDDGTAGEKGVASDLLDRHLMSDAPGGSSRWVVCACGPTAMMKATAEVADRHGVPCYLSLESPMACGFGVCVGCVTGFREAPGAPLRFRRICVDGPVFDARQICW